MLPKIRLSRLRDIGWTLWDPIGLLEKGEAWDHKPNADEYDGYLLKAAGQLRRDAPAKEVVDFLIWAEAENMGLGNNPSQRKRYILHFSQIAVRSFHYVRHPDRNRFPLPALKC